MKNNKIQKFEINNQDYKNGFIGVDEVGRGSLIGPVITCSVFLNDQDFKLLSKIPYTITDSKKLNKKTRKHIVDWVNTNNIKYHIGSASVQEIDELNIREANNLAMNLSIYNLILSNYSKIYNTNPNKYINCYIDGNYFSNIINISNNIKFTTIIKGDNTNIAIALASIIAKEYRDDLICKISNEKQFKPYKWNKNMGYGTAEHLKAILNNGISIHHRLSFLNKLIYKNKNNLQK
jgi:ribonuclease HII